MATALTNENWTCSPRKAPDSPDYHEKEFTNSDDLEATSNLYGSSVPLNQQAVRQRRQHLVIVGSHEKSVTLGRGGASTIKIGRRNRQISRIHVSISYSKESQQFELLVIGLNGACVDQMQYAQHEVAALENDSFIDILGDHFYFKVPPAPLNFDNIKSDVIVNKKDIFRELSPEAEEGPVEDEVIEEGPVEDEVLEEEYPVELVPEDPLSSEEKELSPEPPIVEESPLEEICDDDTNDYAEVIIDALGMIRNIFFLQVYLFIFDPSILSYLIHANQ